jgi:hypothetical protein
MNPTMIRIVAAVVDTESLTLYKTDGSTITIAQGDPRVRKIVTEVTPLLISQGYADIDIHNEVKNSYADFEEKSGGLVKFFRVAKNKLKHLFNMDDPIEEQVIGHVPNEDDISKMSKAVDDIMKHATPVSSPSFTTCDLDIQQPITDDNGNTPKQHTSTKSPETIVAVVDGKVIPGMEKIHNQFDKALKMGSTKGVENFLKRLGNVIEDRNHSVDDLLKFMERGDLPIADDGSILVYKVLNTATKEDGSMCYVDCHSKKVKQWVGAYVCMAPSLVDPNRRNECSNGLHIARRGYINQFSGSVCTLCKLAPEDVIAVPEYDANKMRVCGYHIIAELSPTQYSLVRSNKPITDDPEGAILLANAIAGKHIERTHEVRITEDFGGGVITTQLTEVKEVKLDTKMTPVLALNDELKENTEPALDPREVVKEVQKTRKELAKELSQTYRNTPTQENYDAILTLKRTSKVSWEKLGIPEPASLVQAQITAKASTPKTPEKAKVSCKPQAATKAKEEAKNATSKQADSQATSQTSRIVNGVELGLGSYRERIRKLIPCTSVGSAKAILELKKKAKRGWASLGVSEEESKVIITLASQDK